MKCKTCGREEPRSSEQNRRYWKILAMMADKSVSGTKYSSEMWHLYFKFKYLGAEDVKLPNGKILTQAKSSASLTKPEFNDYMIEVELWCNENGFYLDG